jgi:hypothetical protein
LVLFGGVESCEEMMVESLLRLLKLLKAIVFVLFEIGFAGGSVSHEERPLEGVDAIRFEHKPLCVTHLLHLEISLSSSSIFRGT